jgi:hypothetical protein
VVLAIVGWNASIHAEQEKMNTAKYFSIDYSEARQKFLEACQALGVDIESFTNPGRGPEGEGLYTDVALIGPQDAKVILMLVSGTHGIEGFAGSGIQTGLLQEGLASRLRQDMSILMVHAINPYGFAHERRCNENNVDLNRNFVDHSKPYPFNSGYDELAEAISPKSISLWANTKSVFRLLNCRIKNGRTALRKAVSEGQYSDPKGLFYGGQKEIWSNKTMRTIIKRYLSNAERVVFMDFHTGLGPYGSAEIILHENEHSPAYKRAVEWWGPLTKTTASGKSVSVHLQATLKGAVLKMLPGKEVTAVSLEFGTFSALKVFWALRQENWLHNYGLKEYPGRVKIKTELLRMFYPDDERWKLKVWKQGKEAVDKALAHLQ